MDALLFTIGTQAITLSHVLFAGLALLGLILLLVIGQSRRNAQERARMAAESDARARELEGRLTEMLRAQSDASGQVRAMAEVLSNRQSELMRTVNERLDGMGQRLNQSVHDTSKGTQESLTKLQERLAVIDRAQSNITELSGQVVQLQQVLNNKQTRGAFGQGRMEAIIADGLPQGAYAFQHKLSNGKLPDCVIFMPNDTPPLVIDAKFPLEGYTAFTESADPTMRKAAMTRFRQDMDTHVKAIAERYFIKGETQDTAFLFVPSESIFAAIHEDFEDIVQKAHRARVVIVSPSLLMLSIQVVQAVLKDARMRELAHVIQKEVAALASDTARLDERVTKLQQHFGQVNKDVEQILISTGKITSRSRRIEDLDVGDGPEVVDRLGSIDGQ